MASYATHLLHRIASSKFENTPFIPVRITNRFLPDFGDAGHVWKRQSGKTGTTDAPPVQLVTPDEPDEPAYSVFLREGSTNIVSWTPSLSATYYNLYESWLFPEEFFATELVSNITGTSYKHTDTSDILDYFYWIQACNEHGCSDLYWVGLPVLLRIADIDRDEGSCTILPVVHPNMGQPVKLQF